MDTQHTNPSPTGMATRPANGRTPSWWLEVHRRFEAGIGQVFGLSGPAVNDYVGNSYRSDMRTSLVRWLSKNNTIVLVYSPASGVRFGDEILPELAQPSQPGTPPPPSQRSRFAQTIGLASGQPANPALAALQAATGQASGTTNDLGADPARILPQIDRLLRTGRNVAVVIEHLDILCPSGDKSIKPPGERIALATIEGWGHDREIIQARNLVIAVTRNNLDVAADLQTASSKIHWLEVAPPNYDERLEYLNWRYEAPKRDTAGTIVRDASGQPVLEQLFRLSPGLTLESLAGLTSGLFKSHIEDVILSAVAKDAPVTPDLVRVEKRRIIASEYGDVCKFLEPEGSLDDLGGIDYIKSYLRDRVIGPMVNGQTDIVPPGLLLMGPPGTGKSEIARKIASESGINCLQFRADKILGGIVGTSEKNLEKLLTAVRALAPTVLFMDELDQKTSRGQGEGNSVQSNIFGRLLEFLADPSIRGRVLFLGATNRPDLLDAALIRSGRFETKLPVLAPDGSARREILEKLLAQRNVSSIDVPDSLIAQTQDWTGADLARLVNKAAALAAGDAVTLETVLRARSLTRKQSQDYSAFTEQAIAFTEDLELLPPSVLADLERREQERAASAAALSDPFADDYRGRR